MGVDELSVVSSGAIATPSGWLRDIEELLYVVLIVPLWHVLDNSRQRLYSHLQNVSNAPMTMSSRFKHTARQRSNRAKKGKHTCPLPPIRRPLPRPPGPSTRLTPTSSSRSST